MITVNILSRSHQHTNNSTIIRLLQWFDNIACMSAYINVNLSDDGKRIVVKSPVSPRELHLQGIDTYKSIPSKHGYACDFTADPVSMMGLTQQLYVIHNDAGNAFSVRFEDDAKKIIASSVKKLPKPYAYIDNNDGKVHALIPHTPLWDDMCRKAGMTSSRDGIRRVPSSRLRDFISLNDMLPKPFQVIINDDVSSAVHALIPAPYDGTDESLRKVGLDALDYVRTDAQPWSMRKASNRTVLEKMNAIGYNNLHDLIVNPPLRYIDRSSPLDVRDLIEGERATIVGTVIDVRQQSDRLYIVQVEDSRGGTLDCSFFNGKFVTRLYHVGDKVIVNGIYKPFYGRGGREYPQMQHPSIDFADIETMPVIPVYHQSGKHGVNSMMIMSCERELVDRLGDFRGPAWLEGAYGNADIADNDGNPIPKDSRMSYGRALKTMHCPSSMDELGKASDSLAFCELVQMMTIIEESRKGLKPTDGIAMQPTGALTSAYVDCLKYDLTGAQVRTLADIDNRMRAREPMHALLVGDVGSGKTTVIHEAALKAVEAGYQAVICAPTEILAMQLYDVFVGIVDKMADDAKSMIHPALHCHYKGKGSAKRRRENLQAIKDGTANVIFGTHSVFSDNVEWHDLGFIGIDEQHKFGAEQRSRLLNVRNDGKVPDMLMQTATPIPRSIAQMYYGDIAYMRLDELPAGRLPIDTQWVRMKGKQLLEDEDNPIWDDIIMEADAGHGTFIICPMVEDSPKLAAASVKSTYTQIDRLLGLGVNVGIVYGSQDKEEQADMIEKFRTGIIQVLVASSVVEVGVSCEQATRMIVLDANRFGLASLHQIRGRIGRGNLPSTCYLVANAYTPEAQKRMDAMTETLDGWKLSQKDLKNRGSGTLFGDSQSGGSDFLFADLVTNGRWIGEARKAALEVLASPQADEALKDSRAWFELTDNDIILS